MTQKHPETQYVIQLAAGIANFGIGPITTAKAHFAPLAITLEKQLHAKVLDPVFPCGLGILGPTEGMARKFDETVEKNLDDYPNARVLFIAHSLGGLLSRRHILNAPQARERYVGLITLGTPHLGVDKNHLRHFKPIVDTINGFAGDVMSGYRTTGETTRLAMTATTRDIIVPCESALPDIPQADRHLFAHMGTHPEIPGNIHRHANLLLEHNGLVAHPLAIMQTVHLARTMLESASQEVPQLARSA